MMSTPDERTPRWAVVFAVGLGLLVALVLLGLLLGVEHGPGQHALPALPAPTP